MVKKTITYVDYNDVERTEDFYFNLNDVEITMMENSIPGGMAAFLQKIVSEKDNKQIMAYFKELICMSYGQKSPDGKRFIKDENLTKEFTQTEAFNIFFMELATNADTAAEFVNGVMPKAKK
jgi:hypothetical protein